MGLVEPEIIEADRLDQLLIHALELDGRVPFARVAELVDVSEQTVARRFRRLLSGGVVRVVGMVDPAALGQSSWIVRITCRPDGATALATALARRSDVGWVTMTSGGSEIICVIRSRTTRQRDELLLQRLPKTAQVIGLSAHAVLRRFEDPLNHRPGAARLPDEAVRVLRQQVIGDGAQSASARAGVEASTIGPEDEPLFAELARDGRAPVARLAVATGWTPSRVSRRMDELVRAGLLYFETEIALDSLGIRALAFLWLTVSPGHVRATGAALTEHPEASFVAATTGTTNLVMSVACLDNSHLFDYVSDGLGPLAGINAVEISPVVRRIKQGGTLMSGDRLAVPTPL